MDPVIEIPYEEDDVPVHTEENDFNCSDDSCVCQYEQGRATAEELLAAALTA
jgi:hypothetical protein